MGHLAGRLGRDFGSLPTDILRVDYGVAGNVFLNAEIAVNTAPVMTDSLSDEISGQNVATLMFVRNKFGGQ